MAPNWMQLESICKNGHESFKEYVQRWRDLAAQVVPSMTEKEMITMIVDTLTVFVASLNNDWLNSNDVNNKNPGKCFFSSHPSTYFLNIHNPYETIREG